MEFILAGQRVGRDSKALVIAEAGVNHNGDPDLAHQLIEAAHTAGAHAIKFQTFTVEELVATEAELASYQRRNVKEVANQAELLKPLELSEPIFRELAQNARERGLEFLSSPHTVGAIELLDSLVASFKIGSADLTNPLLIRAAVQTGKPIILSSGMATLAEIETALSWTRDTPTALLHCTSNYPCPPPEVNLRVLSDYLERFDCPIGYSDHTEGLAASLYAVARGATLIEKHFTIDRCLPGPDHAASLEPKELKELIERLEELETLLGDREKRPQSSELEIRPQVRKALAYREPLAAGQRLEPSQLLSLRPESAGVPTSRVDEFVGRVLRRDVAARAWLSPDDFT